MEGAQGEKRLRALEGPDHARLLETMSDDGLARTFDDTRSNEPAVRPVLVVLHPYELPAWAEEMGNFHRLVSVAMSERKEYNFRWSKSEVEFHILTRR